MTPVIDSDKFLAKSQDFLSWLAGWHASLGPIDLATVAADPARVAIVSVDLINGFCYQGNLSSPRIAALVPPIVSLFKRAFDVGVRNLILVQEWHSEHAQEFNAFAPHAIRETREAQTVPELARLPFADEFIVFRKNSLHTITGTGFEKWLQEHSEVDTFIVVGDCTDLCTYDLAMGLKLRANQMDVSRRVIVPENCVQTFDLPVAVGQTIGAMPHDGDLLHLLFLYMMALNRIEIVRELS